MVRTQEPDDYAKLDRLVQSLTAKHELKLDVSGWSRKTYDVYIPSDEVGGLVHMARIESFATTSGEIRVFDDRALPFAEELGAEMEKIFDIGEAVIVRD